VVASGCADIPLVLPTLLVYSLHGSKRLRTIEERLAVVLRQVAEPAADLVVHGSAAPADLAGVGFEHPEDDAHGGGLAGAVGPDEAERLVLGDGER
jgi:hypothetical protein